MAGTARSELRIQGDPRRPQDLHPYAPPAKSEDQQGDLRLIGSMMCGLASMLTKIPWFSWAGLLLVLVYIANAKSRDFDLKTTISSIFFCLSGLGSAYLVLLRPPQG